MPATSSSAAALLLRAARPSAASRQPLASALRRQRLATARPSCRFQSSSASSGPAAHVASHSWFQRMWNSPIGLKTVHFWAPVLKWALVIAGLADFARPVERLSIGQNLALTATGLIWTRWCLIIKPKNYLLAAVNFFLGLVGVGQVSRIAYHRMNSKPAAHQDLASQAVSKVKEVAAAVEDKVKSP